MMMKSEIEEKRVKSTVIRRRTVVTEKPALVETVSSLVEAKVIPPKIEEKVEEIPAIKVEGVVGETEEKTTREIKPKKVVRKKTREELDMEMIERAGGLKKIVQTIDVFPERLERVYRPEKSGKKRKILTKKEFKKTELTSPKAIKKVIRIENRILVSDLAHRMGIKGTDVVKKLMELGMMVTLNQTIDFDTALLIAQEFGFEIENIAFAEKELLKQTAVGENLLPRPPIVTVMGHVDHGKTSLLDQIRKTNVAGGEAGGITQHIGAYQVTLPKGTITFLDTPGHEAFTSMRARGAKLTDLVILVVAADDGVMPQTIEAVHHAKAAKVPLIVAINKVDKPGADIGRVERALMEQELVSEKLGGETIMVPVSAKAGTGIEELLEMVLLQSEVLELRADPSIRARGVVIEARVDRGRGPVATVIVQQGTLRLGEPLVVGRVEGRVRALFNAEGQAVTEATPAMPVEVLGLSGIPEAGDLFDVTESEEDARQIAEHRSEKDRESKAYARPKLENIFSEAGKEEIPELRLIVKADVHGSAEAVRDAVQGIKSEKAKVAVIHWGVGAITESDVMLAITSKAIVIGFNTRPDNKARELAEQEGIQIRKYSIIYDLLDEIRKAMKGLLKPLRKEQYLGRATVKQLFKVSKIGMIAGSSVLDGKIVRSERVRVIRDGKIVCEGKLASLKRFKDDAREVTAGQECGIGVENFNDLKPGDLIESFSLEEIADEL